MPTAAPQCRPQNCDSLCSHFSLEKQGEMRADMIIGLERRSQTPPKKRVPMCSQSGGHLSQVGEPGGKVRQPSELLAFLHPPEERPPASIPELKLLPITAVAQIYLQAGTLTEVGISSLKNRTPLGEQQMLKSNNAREGSSLHHLWR